MISPARKLSFKLLRRIESNHVFSDDALNSDPVGRLDVRDRHLVTEIVYGTLRWQAALDHVLTTLSARPWEEVSPDARILLRMSLYQMWKMDRMPDHALVNDAVELAKRELGQGIERYLNGILRRLTRSRPWEANDFLQGAPAWVRVSLPQWLWDRWAQRYGEQTAADVALSLNQPPRASLRLNGAAERTGQIPFDVAASELVPGAYLRTEGSRGQGGDEQGCALYQSQDEASQLIPHLLGPDARGWRVWDACAAPGGKTSILRTLCGESGRVTASDLRWERIARLLRLSQSSGVSGMDVVAADACRPAPFRACFDAVLADVPCSGLGTLRRNPEIKWRFKPEDFASLQRTQQQILDSVSNSVKSGGRLLYSTCSTEPEENELVIESFMRTHKDFTLEKPVYPPGIEQWIGQDYMLRTFSGTRLWDGFFAALLVRR
jgi:16S rRNA (cytosine967-C5)-methyltransferase